MSTLSFPDPKDAAEDLDYAFDFALALGQTETIETATVVAVPVDAELSTTALTISAVTHTNKTANFRAQAGTVGQSYFITCEITTSDGNTLNRRAKLKVKDL
jgi:hypothetical protein